VRPFKRKSRFQRLLATVTGWFRAPIGTLGLSGRPSDKTLKAGLIAAGGLTRRGWRNDWRNCCVVSLRGRRFAGFCKQVGPRAA
jgi:hypothetical protein